MTSKRINTAIFISGTGSNMSALIKATQSPDFPAHIALVFSDKPQAKGLAKAQSMHIKTHSIDYESLRAHPNAKQQFEQQLNAVLDENKVELICLAGFMRLLSPAFVGRWQRRILNIHPSLLPAYRGLHTHQRALQEGAEKTGCTVHYVDEGMDTGEIIAQAFVAISADDTVNSLQERVLIQEHKLYPQVLLKTAQSLIATKTKPITLAL